MSKKQKAISLAVLAVWIVLLLVGIVLTGGGEREESIREVMRNEVLHESTKILLFGWLDVNPGLISAFCVTALLTVAAVLLRIFVIPKFREVPGRLQLLLEEAVGCFDRLAKGNSPHRNGFLGAYVFVAGTYIFVGTMFELFGFQVVSTNGVSVALPAPLSDINGAIAMGFLTYGVILSGGVCGRGLYLASRSDSGVRADHACRSLLRRGDRTAEAESRQTTAEKCLNVPEQTENTPIRRK